MKVKITGTPSKKNNNLFADGGLFSGLHTNGLDWLNPLTTFDKGSTHELNSNEGVPQGLDEEGTQNLVELGETKAWGDYIFSDRLTVPTKEELNKELKSLEEDKGGTSLRGWEIKILKNYAGLTYAKASKKAYKDAEERPNDPISKSTLDNTLQVLANSLEKARAIEELNDKAEEIKSMSDLEFNQMKEEQESQEEAMLQLLELLMQQLQSLEEQLMAMLQLAGIDPLLFALMPPELLLLIIALIQLLAQSLLLMSPEELLLMMMQLLAMLQLPMMAYGGKFDAGGPLTKGLMSRANASSYIRSLGKKKTKDNDTSHSAFSGAGSGGRFKLGDYSEHRTFNEAFDAAREYLKSINVDPNNGIFKYGNNMYNTKSEPNPLLEINNRIVGASDSRKDLKEGDYNRLLNPADVPGALNTVDFRTPTKDAVYTGEYKYGGKLFAEGGDISLEELQDLLITDMNLPAPNTEPSNPFDNINPQELSTSELNTTIDLIINYAKENKLKDVVKAGRKAKRGSRETKEEFVEDSIDDIQMLEAEKQELALKQNIEQLNALELLMLLEQLQQLAAQELAMLLQAMLLLMMLQQSVEDPNAVTLETMAELELNALFAKGGNLYEFGGEYDIEAYLNAILEAIKNKTYSTKSTSGNKIFYTANSGKKAREVEKDSTFLKFWKELTSSDNNYANWNSSVGLKIRLALAYANGVKWVDITPEQAYKYATTGNMGYYHTPITLKKVDDTPAAGTDVVTTATQDAVVTPPDGGTTVTAPAATTTTEAKTEKPKNDTYVAPYPLMSDRGFKTAMGLLTGALLNNFLQGNNYGHANSVLLSSYTTPYAAPTILGTYATYNPLDRNYYMNTALAQNAATRRALLELASLNKGIASANILASDYNLLNNLGTLARQGEEYNREQYLKTLAANNDLDKVYMALDLSALQTNANIALLNAARYLLAVMLAALMKAALDLERDKAISSSISGIANLVNNNELLKYQNALVAWAILLNPRWLEGITTNPVLSARVSTSDKKNKKSSKKDKDTKPAAMGGNIYTKKKRKGYTY